jgi:hypothetical protein
MEIYHYLIYLEDQADLSRRAFRKFGKGRRSAGLNFGDCFSYALSQALDEPLLFKGNDFPQTDLPCHPASSKGCPILDTAMAPDYICPRGSKPNRGRVGARQCTQRIQHPPRQSQPSSRSAHGSLNSCRKAGQRVPLLTCFPLELKRDF